MTAKIHCNNNTIYLKKIDVTHLFMSFNMERIENTIPLHVGQINHQPYYKDVYDWLGGLISTEEIDGRAY